MFAVMANLNSCERHQPTEAFFGRRPDDQKRRRRGAKATRNWFYRDKDTGSNGNTNSGYTELPHVWGLTPRLCRCAHREIAAARQQQSGAGRRGPRRKDPRWLLPPGNRATRRSSIMSSDLSSNRATSLALHRAPSRLGDASVDARRLEADDRVTGAHVRRNRGMRRRRPWPAG
jgi:hypothetical protein